MINLSNFDFLSPRITLYQKGKIRHSSIFSGILTLLSYSLCFLITIYFSLELIQHKKPMAYFYKSFKNETGYFPLNSSSLFHYILFMNAHKEFITFNSKYLRIKGVRNISYNLYPDDIDKEDHWIYDICDSQIQLEEDIEKLIYKNNINYFNGACVKYYFNSTDKTYYKHNHMNYIPPYLLHGNSRTDNLYYSIIIERCRNNSIDNLIFGNSCASNDEMNDFFRTFAAVFLQIVDHNIDINNYYKPIETILYPISSGVLGKEYAQHNLNFSPLIVKTNKNILFDIYDEQISFLFEENRKNSKNNSDQTIILCEFVFWMQNIFQIYERNYKNISDVLASAGGFFEAIITIGSLINYYYHRYIINFNSINLFKEKEKDFFYTTGKNINKSELNCLNTKNISHKLNYTSGLNINLNKSNNENNSGLKFMNTKVQKRIQNNNFIHEGYENKDLKMKLNFNFKLSFIGFICPCKNQTQKNSLNIIQSFRKKLLSEEHLYRNHLELYFLEQFCNLENKDNIGMNELYKRL